MRILLFLVSILISGLLTVSEAQERSDSTYYQIKGNHQINLGLGTLNTESFALSFFGGTGAGSPSTSINLEYMYGLSDNFAIGLHTSYYRVDAQQVFDLGGILDDPLCELACLTGIGISPDCNCNDQANAEVRTNSYTVAVKGAYHIKKFKHLDTYTSFIAGYSLNKQQTITERLLAAAVDALNIDLAVPSFVYAGSVGARYYFDPHIAAYGEYGYSNVHTLKLGLTYRFF